MRVLLSTECSWINFIPACHAVGQDEYMADQVRALIEVKQISSNWILLAHQHRWILVHP